MYGRSLAVADTILLIYVCLKHFSDTVNEQYCILNLHTHDFDGNVVIVCLFIYIRDDDLVVVETCRRIVTDK